MKYIAEFFIILYKKLLSPILPKSCKYYPTCSNYALESYKRHGFIKGTILSAWRILRCNPWSKGGVDKVPEEFFIFKRNKKKEEK